MSKISVIIPTMWMSELLHFSINEYISSKIIDEILIIDNNPSKKFNLPQSQKIKYLSKGQNIFVNPAWNWGVKESVNKNLLIVNDDVYIQNIDNILDNIKKDEYDLIGLDYENINLSNKIIVSKSEEPMKRGYGCFFLIKKEKYFNIPEDLKIFYGDVILYNTIKNRYKFSCPNVKIELSKTIKTSKGVIEVIENNDKPLFTTKYSKIYPLL